MNATEFGRPGSDEHGFGLIEIVVSMFLLGILAIAFLPLLVQGIKQSAANATLATATQLVQQDVEITRSLLTCESIVATNRTVVGTRGGARGVSLTVARTVASSCPLNGYPITVPVTVKVTRDDTGDEVAIARTLVFVAEK